MNTPKKPVPASSKKQTKTIQPFSAESVLFTKDNYKWMVIGLIILAIGFFLMAGGKSADPNVFNDNEIYSFRRITLAPILIVGGLLVEIYAIMKKQK